MQRPALRATVTAARYHRDRGTATAPVAASCVPSPTALLAALQLWAAPASPSSIGTSSGAGTASSACPDQASAAVELGLAAAPLHLDAFLDPSSPQALVSWVELLRIVGEREPELHVAVWLVRPLGPIDPRAERVRRLAWAAARLGRVEPVLRQVARVGAEHVAAALASTERRHALAATIGLEPALLDRALADVCDAGRIDLATIAVVELGRGATLGLVRLPAFALGELVFDDAPTLERVRPELAREPMRRALRRRTAPAAPPEARPRAERLRVPPPGGLVLGGVGLRHRLLVMAQAEDDPSLFLSLPRALQHRADHPGQLSVHVLARGQSLGASILRHRLCAARTLGRELDYARLLAAAPDARQRPDDETSALLHLLDEVPEEACEHEPDPARTNLAEGTWLDGLPRSPTELEDLPTLLELSAASARPLAPWSSVAGSTSSTR
jgi:hypothetical protein